jgi:hypothetical protein
VGDIGDSHPTGPTHYIGANDIPEAVPTESGSPGPLLLGARERSRFLLTFRGLPIPDQLGFLLIEYQVQGLYLVAPIARTQSK